MGQIAQMAKKVIIFTSPVWLLAVVYLVCDPFYVLRHYDAYPDNYLHTFNRNRISTQVFLNENKEQQYDSFVFGSSRSSVFYTKDWEKHIDSKKTYHFDASNEPISGIHGKVKFIAEQGNDIKNALLIFDNETFKYTADTANSVIHIQDWRWTTQNRLSYHLVFFKAFFKELYFVKYFDVLINKKYKPYMYGVFEPKHMLYTPVKNDFIFQEYIDRIAADSLSYYQKNPFFERSSEIYVETPSIEPYQVVYLNEIKAIFESKGTKYKIVFGPNYDQKGISPTDLEIVKEIFGSENVFNFAGVNSLTEPVGNYYEIYHYKPAVARTIMDSIYTK
ncbi:hypothetical protein SAMN06298216_0400 [Spirosomataceae bacterium TFI 002]|nr:hypothetical protein SAMN06298216_0400 [Spirosomataceae bacterium TFI 002]